MDAELRRELIARVGDADARLTALLGLLKIATFEGHDLSLIHI